MMMQISDPTTLLEAVSETDSAENDKEILYLRNRVQGMYFMRNMQLNYCMGSDNSSRIRKKSCCKYLMVNTFAVKSNISIPSFGITILLI